MLLVQQIFYPNCCSRVISISIRIWRNFMKSKRCMCCHKSFQPRPQVPNQICCSAPECQRERRRRWQQSKLQTDPDYRDNQSSAQRVWMDKNPKYFREYRRTHPDYVESNRKKQRLRDVPLHEQKLVKMDASTPLQPFPSGVYRIRPAVVSGLAKMDACIVEITLLSATCPCNEESCKEMT